MLEQLTFEKVHEICKDIKILRLPKYLEEDPFNNIVKIIEIPLTKETKIQIKTVKAEDIDLEETTKKVLGIVDGAFQLSTIKDLKKSMRIVGKPIVFEDIPIYDDVKVFIKTMISEIMKLLKMRLPISTEIVILNMYKTYLKDTNRDKDLNQVQSILLRGVEIVNTLLYKLKRAHLNVMSFDGEYDSEENIKEILISWDAICEIEDDLEKDLKLYTSADTRMNNLLLDIIKDSYVLNEIDRILSPTEFRDRLRKDYELNKEEGKVMPMMLVTNALRSILVKEVY